MFSGTAPTTEIEAVNIILSTIGEQPVAAIEGNQYNSDVTTAHMILRLTMRDVLIKGWTFNFNSNVLLQRDPLGIIILPPDTVRAVPCLERPEMCEVKWTIRSQRLFDKKTNGFIWNKDVYADITLLLPFESMPEAARHYIMIRAARRWQAKFTGSQLLHQFTSEDEQMAMAIMSEYEVDEGAYNLLGDSKSVYQIWNRNV